MEFTIMFRGENKQTTLLVLKEKIKNAWCNPVHCHVLHSNENLKQYP